MNQTDNIDCTSASYAMLPHRGFSIGRLTKQEVSRVAELHFKAFGDPSVHGYSIATLGSAFLERVFYRLTFGNPLFFCDVARDSGEVIGFSVYTTSRKWVFGYTLLHRIPGVLIETVKILLFRQAALRRLIMNARYLWGEKVPGAGLDSGWWMVAAVDERFRTREYEERSGIKVATQLFDHMEATMMENGCASWYGVVRPDNPAIKTFLEHRGALLIATAKAQGLKMEYYLKTL